MDEIKTKDNLLAEVAKSLCLDHGKSFYYWCNDCNTLLCLLCVTSTHKKHDFDIVEGKLQQTKIKQVLEKERENLTINQTKLWERVDSFMTELKEKQSDLNDF